GWDVLKGHKYAIDEVFEPLADHAAKLGIGYITFWVFSTENWDREKREIAALMNLFRKVFDEKVPRLHEKNYRIKHIGNLAGLPEDIQKRIIDGVELTKANTGLTLTFAMNYGGQDELERAIQKIAEKVIAGKLKPEQITKKVIAEHLDTAGMPEPDLIVRTSGEQRLSGFMSWQSNYAEFSFPEFSFPEFTPEKLAEVLADFAKRDRRFGGK
ncbi:MAG: di-trans,poly-cis-decaprenylcistransferase, partial [Candidatus Pacebacteria bacterium CG10_big_fil_rev_8_21_14_0_10_45_6]